MECSLCRDTGWLLECKDRANAATMEIIPCLIPDCKSSGKNITLMSMDYMRFSKVAFHPKDRYIMSVSKGAINARHTS